MRERGWPQLVAYRAASDGLAKGAFLVVTILAARRLTPEAFGLFAVGSTLGWLAGVAADFGVQMHLAREVARAPWAASRLLSHWLIRRLWASSVVLGVTAVVVGGLPGARQHALALILFAIGYLAGAFVELLNHFYRGLSRSDVESTLTLVQRGIMVGLAALALWWWPDVRVLAAALVIPGLATVAWSLPLARRLAGEIARAAPATVRGDAIEGRFWPEVAPIGAGILLSALYFRVDVFLVERWSGMEAAGLYNSVFRLVDALRLFPAAVLAVFLPALVRATDRLPLARVAGALTGFGVAVALAVWPVSGRLVPLIYGPGFDAAVPAFRVLLAAFPLMSLNYALTHQLIGWNRHRAYAALCAAALVVNIGLNARLIPTRSMIGAAWATLVTEAVLTAGCLWALRPARRVLEPVAAEATS